MAVEAPHMTLNPSQFLPNRDMIDHQPNAVTYGIAPLPMIPMYGAGMTDSFPTPAFKADSGLTSSLPRKRPRHDAHVSSFTPPFSLPNAPIVNQNEHGTFAFFGEDIASHIYQQQLEIDRFVSHHTEKVRTEIQEMRKRNSRRLIAAAQEGIMKRLKAKEDEIVKIGQMNWSLEEKVKSLNVENQIWRELAETNEATANALRNNLQQVQEQLQLQQHYSLDFNNNCASIDDAQSHCGSNHELDRMLAEESGGERKNSSRYGGMNRRCRNCGKEESCVLLLPCRHLCMCTICASSISICPVCKSKKSAGVHVNMS
ncbi:probable BOI-related E3 ubiquitin-protein ligase 2 [Lactuca sativa]|uniref:RING-type domain-containing protein n=1 Tax=Lactuca sativa TaxID=4236 RepID=A0A9R1UX58_LACSA|nr:probable BOI-related E3 ubiquitin-protein ligase 2 [Lactuca sativa]KAJ0194894.1 hypothetical protein LSAT_V11C700369980 [Lactuca sativa]